ncbi:MAG: UpxY family transcription antiterminator [Sedimentisphaerales bacterium]|nr:UpxY family transcription antiterminator [Sedimentisphaerales bacterium]
MLKLSENPPCTWPESKSVVDFQGQWWVAHTKSRNEKSLAHDLISKNISYFLPMRPKVSHIRGRKVKSILPLFSGYLFFCGDEKQRVEVLKTNRVANIIEVINQKNLISELAQIEQVIKAGLTIQPHKYIKEGQRCRVTSGPLKNTEGIVQKTKTSTRLILSVEMLGQAASVEVDTDNIELID